MSTKNFKMSSSQSQESKFYIQIKNSKNRNQLEMMEMKIISIK